MSSLFRSVGLVAGIVLAVGAGRAWAAPLRVCADPNDMPFSNRAEQGFENRIALLLGNELGKKTEFMWARSRRGFLREEFNKGACDMLLGVPQGMKGVLTSEPYYVSSYVFVTRVGEHLQITSFSDPRLDGRRIGLQILEDDLSPPSLPLIRYGHAGQLVGFDSFGSAAADIVRAVAGRRVGAAVVWGPIAGYYAARLHLPVMLNAVSPEIDLATRIPFVFAMTVAVHQQDRELLGEINHALVSKRNEIGTILDTYHVPLAGRVRNPESNTIETGRSGGAQRVQRGAL